MSDSFSTPILVVWDSGTPNRFSGYITEILDIEGYNWRVVHDLASAPLTAEVLEGHHIVILTHIEPPEDMQDLLIEYLRDGGNLIALRPPREMAGKLGLNSSSAERSMVDRYVSFSSICAINAGVDHGPLQFPRAGRALHLGRRAERRRRILCRQSRLRDSPPRHSDGRAGRGPVVRFRVRPCGEHGAVPPGAT